MPKLPGDKTNERISPPWQSAFNKWNFEIESMMNFTIPLFPIFEEKKGRAPN